MKRLWEDVGFLAVLVWVLVVYGGRWLLEQVEGDENERE
jgi:hypothetical protein